MSDTPEKIGGMKLLTVDEMRERFPLPSTPETDAFYGELHPEQGLLEHARSLERRLQEAQRDSKATMADLLAAGIRLQAALRRYGWLADKVIAPDYGDNDSDPHQKGYLIRHCKGPEVIYGASLDAAIDAAIAEKGKP